MRILIAIAALCLWGHSALAQSAGMSPCGTGTNSLSVSVTSSNVAVPGCANTVIVYNITSQEAFYKIVTTSAGTAATSDFSIPGNTFVRLAVPVPSSPSGTAAWIAAITASSTTTLRLVPGRAN